ncbi:hypothetical protein PIROE2DRAFT_10448, partial [Piromyces sp. E2]
MIVIPIIKKTLYGLLYKYSKGKNDNVETTAALLEDKIEGFSLTMHREGEGEELLEELSKTEGSFALHDEPFKWTSYKYFAKTERNKEAGRLGLQSFKDNITKVMLFCPEIHSVELNDNGKILTIDRGDIVDNLKGGCEKLILNINDNGNIFTRNFVYTKHEEDNKKLYQNFEPDSERQSILLDGKEENEITHKISEQGINKMILSRSQQMYERLLECLCEDDKKVPTYEESLQYGKYIWKKDNNIKYIGMKECTQYLSTFENMDSISNKIKNVWEFIDDFLMFIKNNEFNYLKEYKIIPNMNSEFIKYENNLATSKEVPDNMTEYNKDKIFVEKRHKIYELCSRIFNNVPNKMDGSLFPKDLWDGIDEIVFERIIEELEKYGKIGGKYNIEFLKKILKCLSENYQFFKNHSIIPNQNGDFCKINNLYKVNQIPELFKECMKNCFNWDIKNILINDELISIKSFNNIRKININNFNQGFFFISNDIPLNRKQEASRYLIRIIPKETNDKDYEWQNDQRKLFNVYKIFSKCNIESNIESNIEYTEIDNEYCEKKLWKYANIYICKEIISTIEKYHDINELNSHLKINNKEEIFEYLNIIFRISSEGKIIPNQNNKFCYLKNLKEEKHDEYEISDNLKDISKKLGYDIREYLIHPKVTINMEKDIEMYMYRDICEKIDDLIKKTYSDPNNHSRPVFKNVVQNLIEEYFEEINDEEHLKKYFPYTFSEKETIILKVLYDKETRKNVNKLGKEYGEEKISKLLDINNKEIIDIIIEENPENYDKILLKDYRIIQIGVTSMDNNSIHNISYSYSSFDESSKIISNIFKSIKVELNPDMNTQEITHIRETFNQIIQYYPDFIESNKRTGFSGEAYIYELLCKSMQFKSVKWTLLSENGYGTIFQYNNKTYIINPKDGSHFDIIAETKDGRHIYIEVKSTAFEYNYNKVPFYLSRKQIETMKSIPPPNEYILAIVFDVRYNPRHFFMNLRENVLYNIKCNNDTYEFIIDLEKRYGESSVTEFFKNNEVKNNIEKELKNDNEKQYEST